MIWTKEITSAKLPGLICQSYRTEVFVDMTVPIIVEAGM